MEEEGVVSERYVSRRTADEEAKEAAEEHVEPLPPSYDDVAGWMSALEADGVDVSSGNPDTIPFNPPPCRAPLAVDEEPKKPCINKVGTMQVTSTRAAHQHYAFQMSAEPTRFAVNVTACTLCTIKCCRGPLQRNICQFRMSSIVFYLSCVDRLPRQNGA